MVGRTLSHYKVLEKIGEGGMGEVYLAQDAKLDREVAIKVLPAAFSDNRERLARFEREARLLASLNHTNIAAIHELEESGEVHFLALEYVPGETLAERIHRGPIPADEALLLFKQIAEGLEAAHEKGVIHRDLKPANIKVTPEGKVKVLDFGLAKALSDEAPARELSESPTLTREATQSGVLLGTAAYMSPEQARGKAVDRRADIWAFGCCLYESFSGRAVFRGETVSDTIAGILKQEPDWHVLPSETPPAVRSLLRRCLAKDVSSRLQHIGDARIEIEEAIATLSKPTELEASHAPKRGITRVLRGLAVLAVGAAVAGIVFWGQPHTPLPRARSVSRFAISLPNGLSLSEDPIRVTVSHDGQRIVFAATDGDRRRLYSRPLDQLEAKPIPGTDGAWAPFFSPDSLWIGFFADGKLKKVNLVGSAPVTLCEAEFGVGIDAMFGTYGTCATWGEDNMIYITEALTPGLLTIPAGGGTPEVAADVQVEKGEIRYSSPQLLPGGHSVVLTVVAGGGLEHRKIVAVSLDTGERKTLIEGGAFGRYVGSGHLLYVRGETLLAAPFDVDRLAVTGAPVPVFEAGGHETQFVGRFSVSSQGVLVYALRQVSAEREVVWVDRRGSIRPIPVQPGLFSVPSLSPDGRRVALTTTTGTMETWIYSIDREALTRFTFEGSNHITAWTPDGKWLTFSSDREGPHNLFRKPADGSGVAERLSTSDWHQDPGSWSPDGKVLAYAQNHPGTGWDIWLLRLDGQRREEPFLVSNFDEYRPMVSTDGRWISYVSNESGREEVYVQPFPDGGRKWLISTEGGNECLWAPDGRELFYRNGEKLMVVSFETEPEFSARSPSLLFETATLVGWGYGSPNFDITADGQRFVMIKPTPQPPPKQINVVLNWFEDLKRLAPTN